MTSTQKKMLRYVTIEVENSLKFAKSIGTRFVILIANSKNYTDLTLLEVM
jgi:hypothetical protein